MLSRLATSRCGVSLAHARLASSITVSSSGELRVPHDPIVPFIEVRSGLQRPKRELTKADACVQGDGTGPDIWRATKHVLDSAVRTRTPAGSGQRA